VNMLLHLIAGQPLEANHVELSTSLVVRESCAPPRSGPLHRNANSFPVKKISRKIRERQGGTYHENPL
jgi:hypothetical protein